MLAESSIASGRTPRRMVRCRVASGPFGKFDRPCQMTSVGCLIDDMVQFVSLTAPYVSALLDHVAIQGL